ncbi:RNA polymerase II subunit 5-mediating homolog isoform X2 [Olea europaea subsp. europaea]|uniref:RNA polymerase II subunit 5-mediating homolog isoform X2 n=1 Tax=Olea europaea subsp. europaea TaxID=158383 RepID=A0A8S0VGI7_OLEEU|nr:RNA polymerase II subunit 5-mediating homolog isoform X2 [Olea europaea subsp. europaea]
MAENPAMKKGTVTPISSLFPAEEAHKASKRVQDTIAEHQEQLDQLKGFMNENTNLINLVQKLPDELHHNIMVPFGKAAFFPGRLIHTNEFMVLLGVDHYVARTSKQTIDILKRRGKGLENQLESLKAVMQDLKAEASFFEATASDAVDGLVEIREDYAEESPSEVVPLANNTKAAIEDDEYARILSRIAELEQEEEAEKANEFNRDNQIENDLACNTIQSFTDQEVRSSKVEDAILQSPSKDGSSHGKGPALDDYSMKKKVLELPEVKEKVQAPVTADNKVSHPSSIPGSDSSNAFTGSIVEHAPDIGKNSREQQTGARSSKPVSRFKMQRK